MNRGDIVLVTWPFTDLTSAKVRPAVVVSSNEFNAADDVILVAISSQTARAVKWDVVARPSDSAFAATGLRVPSAFKCGTFLTLNRSIVKKRLGAASAYMPEVEAALRKVLHLQAAADS